MKLPASGKALAGLSILFFFLVLIGSIGCYKEVFTTDAGDKLRFSTDTLRFDTVFTAVGSATRSFKIYNDAQQAIKISKIKIKNASSSVFRLNVDGVSAPTIELNDVEIGAQDSIYAFLEVTINPNQPLGASPFIIGDEIEFTTNGNNQSVHIEAWGQNANYIPNQNFKGGIAVLSCNLSTETWSDSKPYVIYGVLIIDSCTLRIPAGAKIYIHGGIVRTSGDIYNDGIIFTTSSGRLLIEGSVQKKVIITTDRLEKELKEEWGAWSGIRFGPGSKGNSINYAEISSPIVGVYADSASQVTIKNSIIYNTAAMGVLGIHSAVTLENCLFHSNGTHSVQFAYGGDYRIDYCTMANYENDKEALAMNNVLVRNPDLGAAGISVNALNAVVTNTILSGNHPDELTLLDVTDRKNPFWFNVNFSNTYIRATELTTAKEYPKFFEDFPTCIKGKANDTLYLNYNKRDFRLDTSAVVNNKGKWIDRVPNDILGIRRNNPASDMGCYELK